MKLFIGLLLLLCSSMYHNIEADTMQASIQEVKNRHQAELLALPGVVSIGIGLDADKKSVIIIGIEADNVELKASLPEQLEGYRVIVQTTGTVRSQ